MWFKTKGQSQSPQEKIYKKTRRGKKANKQKCTTTIAPGSCTAA
jgi:hypothetical protein